VASKSDTRLDEAVIICGGQGTRLRDVVTDRPKALVDVCGRPFIEWQLLSLAQRDQVRHVILATGHLADAIEHHFGENAWCGLSLSYSREAEPLGTAGALRLAALRSSSPRLLVLNGDTYCRYDSGRLLETHLRNSADATLWLSRVPDSGRFGSVAMSSSGSIVSFGEKANSEARPFASAGVYIIENQVTAGVPPGRVVSLEREVFPSLVGRGLYGIEGKGTFLDIGTPESLETANEVLAAELDGLECK
jgi:NDP-sugar pyrophosphorylase family protein